MKNSKDGYLRCRTTKLLFQKRLSSGILLLLTRGDRPEKRRYYYLKKSPSNCILHQSHSKPCYDFCPMGVLWPVRSYKSKLAQNSTKLKTYNEKQLGELLPHAQKSTKCANEAQDFRAAVHHGVCELARLIENWTPIQEENVTNMLSEIR